MANAKEINRNIRDTLIENGFKGVLPLGQANRIIRNTLAELNITSHKISVEPSSVHTVGEPPSCNCEKTIIRVEPLPITR